MSNKDLLKNQNSMFRYAENSFDVNLEKETKSINWEEIIKIEVYKIDQVAFDCIIANIHLNDTIVAINEEMDGFIEFMEIASDKLNGFKKDWFKIVAFPAFERNLTTIYDRKLETL